MTSIGEGYVRIWICALVTLYLSLASAYAQSGSGELTGRLTDPSGAALVAAPVRLTEQATGLVTEAATTTTGDYTFRPLRPGGYMVTVSAPGFATLNRGPVTISTGERIRLDLALTVGAASGAITVSADAPLLRSDSGSLSTTIPRSVVNELPSTAAM